MEPEYTIGNQTLTSSRALSLPHFDEEATLLSARPVVPLHQVKAKARSRLRLVFVFTSGVVLLVWFLSATLIYRQYEDKYATSVVEVSESASDSETQDDFDSSLSEAGGSAIESDQAALSSPQNEKEPAPRQMRSVGTAAVAKKQALHVSRSLANSVTSSETERTEAVERDEFGREMRRPERRERRLRLRAEREARERAQSSDGLLRIQEIFEGSPRP